MESRWSMCVLPWLHIEEDEECLSWLPCCRVLSSSDICWGGAEGGRRGPFPCRALMWVWCASMGILCCTPIITNIFRRHSPPRCVCSGNVCEWFIFTEIPWLKIWLTISFWQIISIVFGVAGIWGEGSCTHCHHKNINGRFLCYCRASAVVLNAHAVQRWKPFSDFPLVNVTHWSWKILKVFGNVIIAIMCLCIILALTVVCQKIFSYFPHMNSEPSVAFLSWHEIEIPQWDVRGGGDCFPM